MRTKEEILEECLDKEAEAPNWSFATLSQERLRLEVLIDIRDILSDQLNSVEAAKIDLETIKLMKSQL